VIVRALALLLLLTGSALAAEPPGRLILDTVPPEAGLPGDTARALAVGPPGVLYVGSRGGVSVFDGERFRSIEPPPDLAVSHVNALLWHDETLYVSSQVGVWRMRDGRTDVLADETGQHIHAQWAVGPDGTVYLADPHGIRRVDGDRLTLVEAGHARGVAVGPDGAIWVAGMDGVRRVGESDPVVPSRTRRLLMLADGTLAVGAEDGLWFVDAAGARHVADDALITDLTVWNGRVVASTNLGILLAAPDRTGATLLGVTVPGVLVRIAADREGQLWIGQLGRGLARVMEPGVRVWGMGGDGDKLLVLLRQGDGVIAARQGRAWEVDDALTVHPADAPRGWIVSMARAGDGWLAVDNDARTWLHPPDGEPTMVLDVGEASDRLIPMDDGRVLVGAGPGAWQVWPLPRTFSRYGAEALTVASRPGADGSLLALGPEGVLRWAPDGFERILPPPPTCTRGEGALATEGGILAICPKRIWYRPTDGDWEEVAVGLGVHGPPLAFRGGAWVTTLGRVEQLAPSRASFGPEHGLPEGPYNPYRLSSVGDWLAFGRTNDVVFVDVQRLGRDRPVPAARIAQIEKLTGDRAIVIASDADLEPGDSFLRLHLAENSLLPPSSIAWRFRMDEGPWSDAQAASRINLPGVPPGRHTIEAQVRAAGGPWSEPARWAFRLPPRWYERRDVQLGFLLAISLVLTGFLVERARRLRGQLQALEQEREFRKVFGRFVAPEVAEEVLGGGLPARGEEREITVIFADLRGFTPLTESLPPAELVNALNRWLTAMVEEIEREGGIVNKFLGDAVVAIFGAPRSQPDHARRAVRAGIAMARRTAALGGELSAGVGINSGTAIAGPIGAESRMEYTVIGEAVNVAARVEALTRTLDADVLITDATYAALEAAEAGQLRDAGAHGLKGVSDAVQVWRWDREKAQ